MNNEGKDLVTDGEQYIEARPLFFFQIEEAVVLDTINGQCQGMGSEILTMRNNPFNQFGLIDRAVCRAPAECFQFAVSAGKREPVYLQKNHHGKYADAFVSVNKGMVFNKGKSKVCRHCLNGRVQMLAAEGMIRRINREVQQIGIPYAVKTATLGDKLAMQR